MKTYAITYRKRGRTHTEDRRAENYYDAAVAVCQSHQLKRDDIISNVIAKESKPRGGKMGTMSALIIGAKGV